jgi:broad specificity phosphatase PhoE
LTVCRYAATMCHMILTIFFVRHGQNEASHQGVLAGDSAVPLNETGREEARRAARFIAGQVGHSSGFVPVYASPLRRTLETAWVLAEALAVAPEVEFAFSEFPLGAWSGRSLRELREEPAFQHYIENPLQHPMGSGAMVTDVLARAKQGLANILRQQQWPNRVIVSHGGIIKLLIADALGMSLQHYNQLQIDEGSVSILRWKLSGDNTWPRLSLLNHLPK